MIGWMWRMLVGYFGTHEHKWEVWRETKIVDDEGDAVGRAYDLRCSVCGDIKRRKF